MSPVMDTDSFWSRVGQDRDLAHELIDLYLAERPTLFDKIRVAALGKDSTALRQSAHALKGMIANFAAGPAVDTARSLEEMGKKDDLSGAEEACATLGRHLVLLDSALAEFKLGVV